VVAKATLSHRRGRTVAAVGAATVFTSGCHLLATGAPPPVIGLLLAVVLTAAGAWWLTRDERGWERLAAAQLGAQLGGHALFLATATDPATHAGHGGLGPELVLLTHVVGAAVAGAWLRRGERRAVAAARRALAALRRLLARLLPARPAPSAVAAPPRPNGPASGVLTSCLRHSIVHRGPPALR
jgi:hypothetical protein